MTFSKDLKTFSINFGEVSDKVFRGTSIAMSTSVIKRTPVKSGRARGNWFGTFGQPSTKVSTRVSKDGSQAISDATNIANSGLAGQTFYLTNNLPYIQKLENGAPNKGSSTQAPNGMVEITVNEFQREVDKQANKHRR